jgi:hypothetical protein
VADAHQAPNDDGWVSWVDPDCLAEMVGGEFSGADVLDDHRYGPSGSSASPPPSTQPRIVPAMFAMCGGLCSINSWQR